MSARRLAETEPGRECERREADRDGAMRGPRHPSGRWIDKVIDARVGEVPGAHCHLPDRKRDPVAEREQRARESRGPAAVRTHRRAVGVELLDQLEATLQLADKWDGEEERGRRAAHEDTQWIAAQPVVTLVEQDGLELAVAESGHGSGRDVDPRLQEAGAVGEGSRIGAAHHYTPHTESLSGTGKASGRADLAALTTHASRRHVGTDDAVKGRCRCGGREAEDSESEGRRLPVHLAECTGAEGKDTLEAMQRALHRTGGQGDEHWQQQDEDRERGYGEQECEGTIG